MAFNSGTKQHTRDYRFVGADDTNEGDGITASQMDTAADDIVAGLNALSTALQADDVTIQAAITALEAATLAARNLLAADIATNTADIATNAADIATNAADIATNAGNLSKTGNAPVYDDDDLDDLIDGGVYTLTGDYNNGPSGASLSTVTGTIEVIRRDRLSGPRVTQILYRGTSSPQEHRRVGTGDPVVWGAWEEWSQSVITSLASEGTWTPVLGSRPYSETTVTYSGEYYKNRKMVFLDFLLDLTETTSVAVALGDILVITGGVPYTFKDGSDLANGEGPAIGTFQMSQGSNDGSGIIRTRITGGDLWLYLEFQKITGSLNYDESTISGSVTYPTDDT